MAMLVSGRVDDVYLFIIFALKCVDFFFPKRDARHVMKLGAQDDVG